MRSMLDSIFDRINDLRTQKMDQKKFLTDRIGNTEQQLMTVTREMKMKIHNMVEEVEQKVSKALNEEIWRLNTLVDEFNLPFHTDALVLNVYKKEINSHVENGLGSNLRARLSTALAMNIETAQREMTERMTALVPKEKIKEQTNQTIIARNQPFEMLYTLNCQNLCADFQEDLEFRFSWGITALIQRFNARGNLKNQKAIKGRPVNANVSFSLVYFWKSENNFFKIDFRLPKQSHQ
jgi:mitofusin